VIRDVFHDLALPIALGVAILLATIGAYWALDALLADHPDYDRGLWEGMAIVWSMSIGNSVALRVLKRVRARKESST
jgi:hypothetical protein